MKIAILSRNQNLYSTKRLVEAAKLKGHEAIIVDHLGCNLINEAGNPHIIYKGSKLEGVDAVIPRIGSSVTFYGTAVVRQFEMMGARSSNSSLSIVRSRDKLRSMQIFSSHEIAIPKTVISNHSKDVESIITEIGGAPLVIKLLEGTQGIGVVLAETKKAAKSVIEAFYGMKAYVLVQEFIKEAAGCDIRALVVNGKVVGAMKRQGAEGDFRSNLHRGGSATTIKLSREEKNTAILAAKAMGLNVAGVDMLQSARGPLVLEVNSSPGLEGIEKATGIDIAGIIIDDLCMDRPKSKIKDKVGA